MSRAALISIHPEHVSSIISGEKVFEYRKVLPKRDISFLVLYCTAPVKKITAVVEVVGRLVDSLVDVWNITSHGSGISHSFYLDYYSGKQNASAFVLGNVYQMESPMDLSDLPSQKTSPQSFCYLNDEDMEIISKRKSSSPTIASSMVFVGGIHGVGKSTICKKVSDLGGYKYFTASSLISSYGKKTDKEKRVDQIEDNQVALLKQLELVRAKDYRVLLDGHFTLINQQGEISPVDIGVFKSMKPDKLVLFKGRPEEIAKRLKERDGKKWDSSFLERFQEEEEKHAQRVSERINTPLWVFKNDINISELAKIIYGQGIS